jgi:uncharacterized protein DUF4360
MPRTSLISLTALTLAAACTPPPDGPTASSEKVLAPVVTTEAGSIESVDYVGTGCAGTAATGISPDKQAVTSTFSDFVAAAGPGTDRDAANRNCLLMMQINVPAGWSYALQSVDYRGFAGLEAGVTASRRAVYLISGSPVHTTPTVRFKGATVRTRPVPGRPAEGARSSGLLPRPRWTTTAAGRRAAS